MPIDLVSGSSQIAVTTHLHKEKNTTEAGTTKGRDTTEAGTTKSRPYSGKGALFKQ